jgi:hypothetical protein
LKRGGAWQACSSLYSFAPLREAGLLLVKAQIYAPVLPFVIMVAAVATPATVLRDRDAAEERERD